MTQTTARPRPGPGFSRTSPDEIIDRIQPYDLSAEAGILGSIIIDPVTVSCARQFIRSAEGFFDERNQTLFRVICQLDDEKRSIDAMILHSTLKTKNLLDQIGGLEYLKEIANSVPTSAHAETYAAIVAEKWKIRQLISSCTTILRDCYDSGDNAAEILHRATANIFKVAEWNITSHPAPLSEIIPDYLQVLDDQKKENKTAGMPCGFRDIDRVTGGLQDGEMILVAARPSVGKTSYAMSVVEHVGILLKKPCAMFSLEMSKEAIALRLLSARAMIDSQKIRKLDLNPKEFQRLGLAAADSAVPNVFIDDTPNMTLVELRTKLLRLKQRKGIAFAAIDYLGLMKMEGRGENRNQEVGALSLGLKNLARELRIPLMVLSQLNRRCEDEQRLPRISDLRDSGNLEQDADLIILLHREAIYHRGDDEWSSNNPEKVLQAQAIIGKQRNGATDTITLTYFPWCTRFQDYNPGL